MQSEAKGSTLLIQAANINFMTEQAALLRHKISLSAPIILQQECKINAESFPIEDGAVIMSDRDKCDTVKHTIFN